MNYYTKKLINLECTKTQYFTLNSEVHNDEYGVLLKGYWEYKGGNEGGYIELWANEDDKTIEVSDFDGAYDLPTYVKDELKAYDIICDW